MYFDGGYRSNPEAKRARHRKIGPRRSVESCARARWPPNRKITIGRCARLQRRSAAICGRWCAKHGGWHNARRLQRGRQHVRAAPARPALPARWWRLETRALDFRARGLRDDLRHPLVSARTCVGSQFMTCSRSTKSCPLAINRISGDSERKRDADRSGVAPGPRVTSTPAGRHFA